MKIFLLTVFFMTIFAIAGCTEKKEEPIYGRSDKDNVNENDEDNFVKYDSDPENDSDGFILPDDDTAVDVDTYADDAAADADDMFEDKDALANDEDIVIPDFDAAVDTDDDSVFIPDTDFFAPPECGNNVVETGEVCEKTQSKPCSTIDPDTYESGWASCNEDCSDWILTSCVEHPCSGKPDFPDPAFIDSNCDGIDGVIADAVFVDGSNGSDINDGSKDNPVATIMKGVAVAITASKTQILVSGGSFSESVTLKTGISIHGAYSGKPSWTRSTLFETVVNGGTQAMTCEWSGDLTVSFLKIRSANATVPGASSVGMMMENCENVTLNHITIISGKGANGSDGVNGVKGLDGNPGSQGNKGCESSGFPGCDSCSTPLGGNGGTSPCGRNGGNGGTPGKTSSSGNAGQNGTGSTDNAGIGDIGGNWDGMCLYHEGLEVHGKAGLAGPHGSNGSSGANLGNINTSGYTPSNGAGGIDGSDGAGGGGGGGGAGGSDYCNSYGSSGGGGGGAGCGGTKGTGGGGGGGSFALWMYKSTGIVLQNTILETAGGGNGGKGGQGAVGGLGALGGDGGEYGGGGEQDDGGCGGRGGDGGNGGRGGHGGGGGGGPSIGLIKINSTIDGNGMISTTYLTGSAGTGGYSDANSGANGMKITYVEY